MKINGIQCEVYDPEKLSHNKNYSVFDFDEAYYINEDNIAIAREVQYSQRNFEYRKSLHLNSIRRY